MIVMWICVGLVVATLAAAYAAVRFTLSGRGIGLDSTYARHGRNRPSHVHGHPGYELSDYQAFTQAILRARMIAAATQDHTAR